MLKGTTTFGGYGLPSVNTSKTFRFDFLSPARGVNASCKADSSPLSILVLRTVAISKFKKKSFSASLE